MKKRRGLFSILTFSAFISVLILSYNNCSKISFKEEDSSLQKLILENTNVGNPLTSSAKTLLGELCTVINRCHSQVNIEQCETAVLEATDINYQIGLPANSTATFGEVIQAESSGSLSGNAAASVSCMTAVTNLTCENPLVQRAYDPASARPFALVSQMIPTSPGSCPSIFNQPNSRNEYYVAPHGSDSNDGSFDRPWASITHAAKKLTLGTEGTTVHVAPGNYTFPLDNTCGMGLNPCSIVTNRSGTATAPITFISDQQYGAKILASGASTVWLNTGDHVRIIGFEIVGSSDSNWGIFSDGSFGQIIGNHIHNIPNFKGCAEAIAGGGIVFGYYGNSHDNDAIGNLIHDIGSLPGNGQADSAYCVHSNGISYRQPRGRIYNNTIYRTGSWGINTFVSATNLQISNNLLFNNGARSGSGRFIGGGILISAETGKGVIDDTTVANNIIRNNSGFGLAEYDSLGKKNLYTNNLMFANGQDWLLLSGITPVKTITADPLMINFRLDGTGNYRLQATSPAIDQGVSNCAAATGNGNCTPIDDQSGLKRINMSDVGPFEWFP